MTDLIDTVVRFHDVRRLAELKRCIFSIAGQDYRPIRIVLTLQRFSAADIETTRNALAPFLQGDNAPQLAIVNLETPEPADARSVLLNLGVENAVGRYLAFLDYDDVLYPDAYRLMISQIEKTGAAIAFARVRVMRLHVYERFFYTAEQAVVPFSGANLADLFRNNFCPLHSYVIDRSRVTPDMLQFVTNLTMEEDYDVLLRICAALPSDFGLVNTNIGDYYYKTDGSNTVPTQGGVVGDAQMTHFQSVRAAIEHRKCTTVVAPIVQEALGLTAAGAPQTVRQVIDRLPAYG